MIRTCASPRASVPPSPATVGDSFASIRGGRAGGAVSSGAPGDVADANVERILDGLPEDIRVRILRRHGINRDVLLNIFSGDNRGLLVELARAGPGGECPSQLYPYVGVRRHGNNNCMGSLLHDAEIVETGPPTHPLPLKGSNVKQHMFWPVDGCRVLNPDMCRCRGVGRSGCTSIRRCTDSLNRLIDFNSSQSAAHQRPLPSLQDLVHRGSLPSYYLHIWNDFVADKPTGSCAPVGSTGLSCASVNVQADCVCAQPAKVRPACVYHWWDSWLQLMPIHAILRRVLGRALLSHSSNAGAPPGRVRHCHVCSARLLWGGVG